MDTDERESLLETIDLVRRELEREQRAHDETKAKLTAEKDGLHLLVAERDAELEQKAADWHGLCLEFADLSDELTRTKQDLELARLRLSSLHAAGGRSSPDSLSHSD